MINIIKKKLIVSEYYEEESFLFFRYLFSSFYGLLIRDFFIEDNSKIDLFSFYIKELIKERLPNIIILILFSYSFHFIYIYSSIKIIIFNSIFFSFF